MRGAVGAAAVALLEREPRAALGPATLRDVDGMARLINGFAEKGLMLPRSERDLSRHVREFVVATDREGRVVACGGLRIYTSRLAEIVGLAVDESCHGQGLGAAVVDSLVAEARALGIRTVFAMTLQEGFFHRRGFETVSRADIPEKVAADCVGCFKREACREIAVLQRLEVPGGRRPPVLRGPGS